MTVNGEATKPKNSVSVRAPTWVWWSRPGTTEAGTFSVLAAAEVALAVIAYWGYALWAHSQAHLLWLILIVPFLLLRSELSVQLGVKWFKNFDISRKGPWQPPPSITIRDAWAALRQLSIRSMLKGAVHFGKLSALGSEGLLGLIAAFAIRIVATACHLRAGLACLSTNWWRTLFATDFLTKPQIIPGHSNERSIYHFDDFTLTMRTMRASWSGLGYFAWAPASLQIFVYFFAPTYLYRMSIKSTAWVHWPLAYISRPASYGNDPEEMRARLWSDPREWVRRVFMVLTFAGALIASIPTFAQTGEIFQPDPISIVEYAFLIDLRTLFSQPWRGCALVVAIITLALTWYGNELSLLVNRSVTQPERKAQAIRWASLLERGMRIRDIFAWMFWVMIVIHAALWLAPSTAWLTGYPLEVIQAIYGDTLPIALRPQS